MMNTAKAMRPMIKQQAKLAEIYIPIVQGQLQKYIDTINERRRRSIHFKTSDLVHSQCEVQFKYDMPTGIMYHLTVELIGGAVELDELQLISEHLSSYGFYDMETKDIGIYQFQLGDGDDPGAVAFQGGKFRIWLRGWRDQ